MGPSVPVPNGDSFRRRIRDERFSVPPCKLGVHVILACGLAAQLGDATRVRLEYARELVVDGVYLCMYICIEGVEFRI